MSGISSPLLSLTLASYSVIHRFALFPRSVRKDDKMEEKFPLLTRRQLVELVQQRTGVPLTYSRLMKDGAAGRAPKPAAIFGNRYLYSEADALGYAKALIRPIQSPPAVGGDSAGAA
jgi:hypothetical protein